MGVMRPDRTGRLAPADVVDLLDEISALLREQGGNQALELSLRDLSMSLQAIQDQLSRAQQTSTPTDPTSLVAPLVDRITDALGALADLPAPQVALPDRLTADLSPRAVELLAGLAPKQDDNILAKVVEKLEALDFRMKGQGKAFGSSGPSNIASDPTREIGRATTSGGDKIATQATLASLEAKDFATQTTLAAILAELTRTNKVVQGSADTVEGYTTIVSVTPSSDITLTGFSADVDTLTDIRYRVRLVTGADGAETVIEFEQLTSAQNSWVPLMVDIAAGTRVAVQVDESEVGAVTCQATIAYKE